MNRGVKCCMNGAIGVLDIRACTLQRNMEPFWSSSVFMLSSNRFQALRSRATWWTRVGSILRVSSLFEANSSCCSSGDIYLDAFIEWRIACCLIITALNFSKFDLSAVVVRRLVRTSDLICVD